MLREKALGSKYLDTLTSMGNLAWVLSSQNKYKEAEVINRQTLALREKVLGPEHSDTLASVYCLAYFLAKQRYMNESLRLYQRAATGYSLVLGQGHPTTLACCQHYADVCSLQEQQLAGASMRKMSRLSRGLAKIIPRSSMH